MSGVWLKYGAHGQPELHGERGAIIDLFVDLAYAWLENYTEELAGEPPYVPVPAPQVSESEPTRSQLPEPEPTRSQLPEPAPEPQFVVATNGHVPRAEYEYPKDREAAVLEGHARGLSAREISEKTGVGKATVYFWIRRAKEAEGTAMLTAEIQKIPAPELPAPVVSKPRVSEKPDSGQNFEWRSPDLLAAIKSAVFAATQQNKGRCYVVSNRGRLLGALDSSVGAPVCIVARCLNSRLWMAQEQLFMSKRVFTEAGDPGFD